jgi:hypothetical protein
MATITISEDLAARIHALRPVVEAVIESEIENDDLVELLLDRALAAMLADILGPVDAPTLVASFQQLAALHPSEVYTFVAQVLQAVPIDPSAARERIGFRLPER